MEEEQRQLTRANQKEVVAEWINLAIPKLLQCDLFRTAAEVVENSDLARIQLPWKQLWRPVD